MRKVLTASLAGLACFLLANVPGKAAIQGQYIEVRNADVWTGPCFANSEVDLTGKEAILGWKVTKGSWEGTNLNGLSVVAIVKANATLGDTFHNPYPAESIVIVDQNATSQQKAALQSFAKAQAGKLLSNVVRVDVAPIAFDLGEGANHGDGVLKAGNVALVKTRALCHGDTICGNEEIYYPPLTKLSHSMPAFTEEAAFTGQGLGEVWNNRDGRSAFVGSFSD